LVLTKQVHGAVVVDGDLPIAPDTEGDVVATRRTGVSVAVVTADCVPVVVLGEDVIAVVHAGWKGLVAGAVERGVDAVGAPRAAWVGPSIRSCCYEVGPDVVSAFEERNFPIADSWHVDPGRAAFVALMRAGVEKIAAANDCTSCDSRYFSHRRDGVTGRQSGLAALL
jgi:YfiH family protein